MEDETEENDEEEIMETDGEVDEPESVVEDENFLNELHMRLNHRAPSDIKKMIRDGVLSLEWTSQMEEELKDFHCEACAAVRLKNQARKERRNILVPLDRCRLSGWILYHARRMRRKLMSFKSLCRDFLSVRWRRRQITSLHCSW